MALDLVAAVRENDLVAVADLVAPDDVAGVPDLVRALGDVASGFGYEPRDNGSGLVDGVAVTVEEVETGAEFVADDVAVVTYTNGTGRGAFDPVGSAGPLTALDNLHYEETDPVDLTDSEVPSIVTVEQDGRWFLSLSGTWFRLGALESDAGGGVVDGRWTDVPVTAAFDSPESAVRGFFDAVVASLNSSTIEPLAAVVPPMQGRALMTYRSDFDDDLRGNDLTSFDAEYTGVDIEESSWGATASVKGLVVSGTNDGSSFEAALSGGCAVGPSGGPAACVEEIFDGFPVTVSTSNILVKEINGGWVVDPLGSMFIGTADRLSRSTPEQTAVRWPLLLPGLVDRVESAQTLSYGENTWYLDEELRSGNPWFPAAYSESWGGLLATLPIRGGRAVTLSAPVAADLRIFMVVDGESVFDDYTTDGTDETWTYTPPADADTAHLVVWGLSGDVEVTIR
ncbi:hypothetical protein [Rhodococcoides kroppenstedtii]|uniref:hypothetical protein n=1 Tax=Rhodococcoides kroppenstedtii TaxID=293050 RepID=UPI00362A726E